MKFLVSFLYDLIIQIYVLGIRIASLFNKKAQFWIQDRKDLYDQLYEDLRSIPADKEVIWFHCASLGEFEMAKPLIESLREQKGDSVYLIVTFFSPSGYRNALKYKAVDLYAYLYPDTSQHAKKWIQAIRPSTIIWVKYEFWYNHLQAAKASGARMVLINASFQTDQSYFKWLKFWYLPIFRLFDQIFTTDASSAAVLTNAGVHHAQVSGDTRIDRVIANANLTFHDDIIQSFTAEEDVIIFGSVWESDLNIIIPALAELGALYKIIIVPHEIDPAKIRSWESGLPVASTRYSQKDILSIQGGAKVLIIDNVGMLSRMYRFGSIAYVGGAFGAGLHNILEPIAYGIPVLFGPRIKGRQEAQSAIDSGFGISVQDTGTLISGIQSLSHSSRRDKIRIEISEFLQANKGASQQICQYLYSQ